MKKIIYMNQYLSSAEFFKSVLQEVQVVLKYYDKIDEVIFDFSGTYKIEPNVIPNLLCVGKIMKNLLGYPVLIRIPETFRGGRLKNYLNEIDFLKLSQGIYEYESDPYTGFDGKNIDPLCGTRFFKKNTEKQEIERVTKDFVGSFAEKYLKKYDKINLDTGVKENIIVHFLQELIYNAVSHGDSESYTTLHAKYSEHTIFIAISDRGRGFLKSCEEEHKEELEKVGKNIRNEYEAINYCIFLREKSRIFGLNAIIRSTLEYGGKVRIHSNDSQIIFTPRIIRLFEKNELLSDDNFLKYNLKKNLEFSGTHIELEIPF